MHFNIIASILFAILWIYARSSVKRNVLSIFDAKTKTAIFSIDLAIISLVIFRFVYKNYDGQLFQGPYSILFIINFIMISLASTGLMTLLTMDILRIILRTPQKHQHTPSRRDFIFNRKSLFAMGAFNIGIGSVSAYTAFNPRIKNINLHHSSVPDELIGLKIIQLSDLHIGPTLDATWLSNIVEKTNALYPDMIFITGDFIDGHIESIGDQVLPLKRLTAKYGVFGVTGNHEYYWKASQWVEHLSSLGINMLENDHQEIEVNGKTISIGGVVDRTIRHYHPTIRPDLGAAYHKADLNILLAHQADIAEKAHKVGFHLQFSGHTHGGQMFPFNFLIRIITKYVAGFYDIGDLKLYVSSGTGFWGPPIRTFIPGEITNITLIN